MNGLLVAIKDLSISRQGMPRPELDHVSLAVERGETVIMLGEADAGKEALMRLLAGVSDSSESATGSLQFGIGQPVSADSFIEPPVRFAYLPGPLAKPLSARASAASQLSRVIARKTSIPRAGARSELALALERLKGAPKPDALDRSPADMVPEVLAWGLLAATIAMSPELVLADRPMNGLPPIAARALCDALLAEQQRQGFAVLCNAMGADIARWLGGRLVVMRHGRIVEEGPASRLTTAQSHAYTQTLLRPVAPTSAAPAPQRAAAKGQPVVQAYGLMLRSREKLTFELRRGGSLALIGEHGSGRHALARQLIGLDAIASGRVVFDAVDIGVLSETMMSRMRRRVAIVAGADDVLDPRLTVSDTVTEPLHASLSVSRKFTVGYRDAALKRVGLSSLDRNLTVDRLSAFDKRRLQVARAIVGAPVLALIDEPLRGLDAFAQSVMRDLLRSFRAEEGPAFLVITSDMAVARALADEAMVFRDGRVIERGALGEMLRAPKQAYTNTLITAAGPVL